MARSRVIMGFVSALGAGALLAGCGGAPNSEGSANGDTNGQATDVVVLYTSEVSPSEIIAAKYQEATGVKVEVVNGSSGELYGRVKSEAGNPQGDVWFSAGAPIGESPELYELPPESAMKNIDPQWITDVEVAPGSMMTTAIMYNSDLVPEAEVPKTYAELADPKWQGKIQIADPAASSAAYAEIIGIHNAGGWELVEKVAKNLVISDNYAGPRAVSDGEASLGLFNEPSISAYADNPQVALVYPQEGVIAMWTNLAIIKGSQRPEAARAFTEWFLGPEGQQMVADDLPGLRPTSSNPPESKGLKPMSEIKLIQYPDRALKDKKEWLAKWEEIITNV